MQRDLIKEAQRSSQRQKEAWRVLSLIQIASERKTQRKAMIQSRIKNVLGKDARKPRKLKTYRERWGQTLK